MAGGRGTLEISTDYPEYEALEYLVPEDESLVFEDKKKGLE